MESQKLLIKCHEHFAQTCRKAPFMAHKYTFFYESFPEDKLKIDKYIKRAEDLAGKVNKGAANDSRRRRSSDVIMANALAGVVSEALWRHFLNTGCKFVEYTLFEDAAKQIDLITSEGMKIEVRSSFPRNGVEFAICHPIHQFDILGPYNNGYKPDEIKKDYYVRVLYTYAQPTDILEGIKKDGFAVYLTGGATWQMMNDAKLSKVKNLVPEDGFLQEGTTSYRVVPFSNALDTYQIKDAILRENNNRKKVHGSSSF